jgi:hypothetical protein
MTPIEVHVGHQVLRVGFEGDRLIAPAGLGQDPGDPEVDDGGEGGDGQADAGVLDRDRHQQSSDGGHHDAHGRDQDERPLEPAGEVLRLGMAVGVVIVRRAGGDRQGHQCHEGRDQVHQRFERVGEESDRAGEQVGAALAMAVTAASTEMSAKRSSLPAESSAGPAASGRSPRS